MKLIIDIDENLYNYILQEDAVYFPDDGGKLFEAVKNGTPFEFGNISVEAIEESSHCPACIHYVQGDVPNVFCDKCKNRDELYRRIENDI